MTDKPPEQIFPKLPPEFTSIIKNIKHVHKVPLVCNCDGIEKPQSQCPCLKANPEFEILYDTLPFRIQVLKQSENCDQLKSDLFKKIIKLAKQEDAKIVRPKSQKQPEITHVFHYIAQQFEIPIDKMVKNGQIIDSYDFVKQKSSKLSKIIPKLSVFSNLSLAFLKIFAYAFSRSLSILTSLADSCMDVLSGAILLIASRMAKSGYPKGEFDELPQRSNQYQFIYANRFESLGVIAFSAINTALCGSLLITAIENIVQIIKGTNQPISFDLIPMLIMIFTITLKICLWIITEIAMKQSKSSSSVLRSFRDDHRNDTFSNVFSFVGVLLATSNQKLAIVDPLSSALFLSYVCYNWGKNCVDEMKQLAGPTLPLNSIRQAYIRLLSQYAEVTDIDEIVSIIGYSQGKDAVLEITVNFKNYVSLDTANAIIMRIEDEFENVEGIERCYVNCVNDDMIDELKMEQNERNVIKQRKRQEDAMKMNDKIRSSLSQGQHGDAVAGNDQITVQTVEINENNVEERSRSSSQSSEQNATQKNQSTESPGKDTEK